MGKKCVQSVCLVWKKLCISSVSTQLLVVKNSCTHFVSTFFITTPFTIHSPISPVSNEFGRVFSTLSTVPIITTIFIYNKRQMVG